LTGVINLAHCPRENVVSFITTPSGPAVVRMYDPVSIEKASSTDRMAAGAGTSGAVWSWFPAAS
jgi:hypothetical protein